MTDALGDGPQSDISGASLNKPSVRVVNGDCRAVLPTLSAGSVQTCCTSPPYFNLRDYNVPGQVGQEQTPDAYVAELVAVFREVRRVLADDGTVFLNLGDSYSRTGGTDRKVSASALVGNTRNAIIANGDRASVAPSGLGDKQLLMIPARVALALQADGWVLRSDIIWAKPNPMPESVTDRPTSAHEHVFLLSKKSSYLYDAVAIQEASESFGRQGSNRVQSAKNLAGVDSGIRGRVSPDTYTNPYRNARNVWTVATQPYSGAHFAIMPPALVERCILAGSRPGDTVLDPFGGAGTTGLVADRLGRSAVLIELNSDYAALGSNRIADDAGLFAAVAAE